MSSGANITLTLTTSAAGKIVVISAANTCGSTSYSVTDTASLSYTQRATTTGNPIVEWTATSPSAQVSDMITITCTGGVVYLEATVFGVKGVNTGVNNGFDSNASLGPGGTVVSGSITVSTSNANDYLYAGFRTGTVSPASGFIQIGTGSFMLVEALNPHPTTIQSGLNIPDPGSNNGGIADALISN
jgi:hypothetical protein